jgi:hypothetical protein
MLPPYNIVTAILGLVTAFVIIFLVRKDTLSANYTVWWFFVAVGLIIFGVFPPIVDTLGNLLNIHYPPILLIIVSGCFLLLKLLFMDIDRSKQERHIRILIQRLALYEQEGRKVASDPDKKNDKKDE